MDITSGSVRSTRFSVKEFGVKSAGSTLPTEGPLTLTFEYGPTQYRGVVLHKKSMITPLAEALQKKYPEILMYYLPISEYNQFNVKLRDGIVFSCILPNIDFTKHDGITSSKPYKIIDRTIGPLHRNANVKPPRDPICMMTHNLDIDYDIPWYRTQFQDDSLIKNTAQNRPVSMDQSQIMAPNPVHLDDDN